MLLFQEERDTNIRRVWMKSRAKRRETWRSFIVVKTVSSPIYLLAFIFFALRNFLIVPVKKGVCAYKIRGYIECP